MSSVLLRLLRTERRRSLLLRYHLGDESSWRLSSPSVSGSAKARWLFYSCGHQLHETPPLENHWSMVTVSSLTKDQLRWKLSRDTSTRHHVTTFSSFPPKQKTKEKLEVMNKYRS